MVSENRKNQLLIQNSIFELGVELKTEWFFQFIDQFLFKIQILNKNDKPIIFLVYRSVFD
jgi:hypothetical protein